MQHLHRGLAGRHRLPHPSSAIQARVRFLAYHRIKPHVPPLVRAPVNSFEFHRCRRTPQVECLMLSLGRLPYIANSEYSSFTVWTTRVSNPVRSPHFRASASVAAPVSCLRNRSSSWYLSISPLHHEFRPPHAYSRTTSINCSFTSWAATFHNWLNHPAYAPFKPNKSG